MGAISMKTFKLMGENNFMGLFDGFVVVLNA